MTARKTPRGSVGSGGLPAQRPAAAARSTSRTREPEPRTRVFVYGTLLAGESNHRHLAYARLVGEAQTRPEFTLYDLGFYPGMVRVGTCVILGEIYEVDEPTLAALDRLEAHPRFYRRTAIELASGDEVETYLLTVQQVADRPTIPGGSWRARKSP